MGVYLLDPIKQNKLFAPHGFLHGFAVPKHDSNTDAVFMYYCDETYCKESELHASPMSLLPRLAISLASSPKHKPFVAMLEDASNLVLSEKDLSSEDYDKQMGQILAKYNETGKLWYKA